MEPLYGYATTETRNLASKNGATGGGTSWWFQSCRLAELLRLYRAVLEASTATPATLLSCHNGQNPLKLPAKQTSVPLNCWLGIFFHNSEKSNHNILVPVPLKHLPTLVRGLFFSSKRIYNPRVMLQTIGVWFGPKSVKDGLASDLRGEAAFWEVLGWLCL